MTEPPRLRVIKGDPSPEEVRAIEAAVLKLWREEQARAAASARPNGWVLAARREGTNSARMPRDAGAWKRSGRVGWQPVSDNNLGRGDAR